MEIESFYNSYLAPLGLKTEKTEYREVLKLVPDDGGDHEAPADFTFDIRDDQLPNMKIILRMSPVIKSRIRPANQISLELWDDPEFDHELAHRDISFGDLLALLRSGKVETSEVDINTFERLG